MMATSTAAPLLSSNVQELADHVGRGSTSLPSPYKVLSMGDADTVVKKEMPTIDFSLLTEGKPDERLRIVNEIGRACRDWGCFKLVNHGVSENLQAAILKAFAEFFDLPTEEKQVYSLKQIFDSVGYGSSYSLSAKEDRYWRDFLRIFVHPEFNSPAKPADFRAVSEEYTKQTREITNELLKAIWESLELEESSMEESLELKSCNQVLVGNIYPPCPQPELVLGMPPHADPCFLSIVFQNDSFNGLQVMHDGKWVVFELIPQSMLVFVGDFMEIVSNGKYKSLLHRVVVRNESTRISVGTSIGPPAENIIIAPAPKLLKSSPALFRGITFKEFLALKQSNKSKESAMDLIKL